jgi:hypothetical protein
MHERRRRAQSARRDARTRSGERAGLHVGLPGSWDCPRRPATRSGPLRHPIDLGPVCLVTTRHNLKQRSSRPCPGTAEHKSYGTNMFTKIEEMTPKAKEIPLKMTFPLKDLRSKTES